MFSKKYVFFLVAYFLFSSISLAQPNSYDFSIQTNVRQRFDISANEIGQYNWSNCYSRFSRDLRIYESNNFLLSPWAVFSGGAKVGSSWMDDFGGGTCQGLYGYATVRNWINGNQTEMSDTITVTFAPKKLKSVSIIGKPLQQYVITINNAVSRNYTSPEPYDFHRYQYTEADLLSIGFTSAELSGVTKITIKAVDADWAFGINGIRLSERDNGSGIEPNPPPTPTIDNPIIFIPGVAGSKLKETNLRVRWLSRLITSLSDDLESLKLPSNRNIFATDVLRGLQNQNYFLGGYIIGYKPDFYQRLLKDFLIEDQNLVEYIVDEKPERRTTLDCHLAQISSDPAINPKLFVFAYDWRQDNNDTAIALKDYIGCVKEFYKDTGKKIRIITHSMGSLVARRYALLYPNDNDVDKIITIGGPWIGAPKGIYSLETGSFIASSFGADAYECLTQKTEEGKIKCLVQWQINKEYASNLREAMITFPGPLQLLPSWYYYRLKEADTGSGYLSVRKNIWGEPVDYPFAEATTWLDERHDIKPGTVARNFHMNTFRGSQDDWRQDTSNIKFYHIYGQQSSNISVGKVKYKLTTFCNTTGSLNCVGREYFEPEPTSGDGTVPTYSSRRISTQDNFNSPNVKRYIEDAKSRPFSDGTRTPNQNAEHTKLTENPRVQKRIEKILLNDDDYSGDDATIADTNQPLNQGLANSRLAPTAETQSFYVSLHNVTGYHLGRGPISPDFVGTGSGPDGSQAIPIGDKAVWLGLPATDGYYVSFYGDGTPIKVQIIKGFDYNRVELLVQYIDVVIPVGAVAQLYLTPFDFPRLSFDSDDNGTFDTSIDQAVLVDNENAKDLEAPVVSFDYQTESGGKLVTLSATDNLSGVRNIYYSHDGQQFIEYLNPVAVAAGENLFVFAEDNNRNRTGIGQIDVAGTTYSIGNRVWFDTNNDGKINKNEFPEEVGVNGVSVSLFADTNADGEPDDLTQPLKTTTTANGYYRFDGLNAGSYIVRVNPLNFADNAVLAGYLNTTMQNSDDTDSDSTQAGENGVLPGGQRNNVQITGILSGSITLGPNLSEPHGETDVSGSDKGEFDRYANLTVDFGFYRLGLSGTVWNDAGTHNGYLDSGENGLSNYRVKLFQTGGEIPVGLDGILGTSDDSDSGILTDSSGNYLFQGLSEGDYIVKVNRQFAVASPQTSASPNDNADFDNNGSNDADSSESVLVSSQPISISAANRGLLENTRINEFAGLTENPTVDFGLFFAPTAANASVNGKVVNQQNRGVGQAFVKLTAINGSISKTVRTNQLGFFNFADTPTGNIYIISVNHKRYTFDSQIISVDDSISGIIIKSNN